MKTIFKFATATALAGALALSAASPSLARDWHHGGWRHNGAAIGFGVGALAGAAIAGSAYNNGYYGYYDDPGYAYAPGYAYDAAPAYGSYAYDGYAYDSAPGYGYYDNWSAQHNTNNFSVDSQR